MIKRELPQPRLSLSEITYDGDGACRRRRRMVQEEDRMIYRPRAELLGRKTISSANKPL